MKLLLAAVRNIKRKSLLFAQLLFTVLVFSLMIVLSYFFARKIVNDGLIRYADAVFAFAGEKVESVMQDARSSQSNYVQNISDIILREERTGTARKEITDAVRNYINDRTRYMKTGEVHITGDVNVFGYFECFPEDPFLYSEGMVVPDGYDATEQVWYRRAISAGGAIIETGRTAAVFAAPKHEHTKKLIADGVLC